jgi:nucleotide-binding universal stress UspA family protein
MISLKQVLVATDFSEPSLAALAYGRELARQFGAVVHVAHVVKNMFVATLGAGNYAAVTADIQRELEEEAQQRLTELVANYPDYPIMIPVLLTSTPPAVAIVEYAKSKDIDVIVVGTHGRGGVQRFVLGSLAERVVRLAPCPVLTVRQSEREFIHQPYVELSTHA